MSATQRRIVVWLRQNLRTGPHSPKAIAEGAGVKRDTVRKELFRLKSAGAVVEQVPHYYRAFMDASDLAQFKAPLPAIHHFQVHVPLPRNGVTLPAAAHPRQATLDAAGAAGWRLAEENGGWHREEWFEGRRVTFSVYADAGSATVFLAASEAPLDAPAFSRYLAFLRGTFLGMGVDVEKTGARVTTADINVDVHGLRIEGATAISLRRWSDGFIRAYNKADRLRFEIATTHPMKLDEVALILETFYERAQVVPFHEGRRDPPPPGMEVA